MAYPRLVSDLLPVGLRGLVLAGLIAILMSSMSACYNASATLVVRDFFMRWKPTIFSTLQKPWFWELSPAKNPAEHMPAAISRHATMLNGINTHWRSVPIKARGWITSPSQ